MKLPWSDAVRVKELEEWKYAVLETPGIEARIDQDGTFDLKFDSRFVIGRWMSEEPRRTKELRGFLGALGFAGPFDIEDMDGVNRLIEAWVTPHPGYSVRKRKPEWPAGREGWAVGILGSANTMRAMDFLGDAFQYVHFVSGDGREGAVILWQDDDGNYEDPRVYTGDFEGFLRSQEEGDLSSPAAFLRWNAVFQNGFMWALDRLGGFYSPGPYISPQAAEAIAMDPASLLPESIDKILHGHGPPIGREIEELRLASYPEPIREAVRARLKRGAGD